MSTKTKSKAQLVLVNAASKGFKAVPSNDNAMDFAKRLLRFPSPEQAVAILVEQKGLVYDAQHPELHEVSIKQPDLDKRYENSEKQMEEAERAVKNTPPHIKSNAVHVGSDKAKVSFGDWTFMDKISFPLIGLAAFACLVMSGVNVFSNLISSGEPVYVQQPLIPMFISLLAPASSITIKYIGSIFEHNYFYKKCFTKFVFLSSFVSFLVWIAFFSASYSGAASGFDWEAAESGSGDLGSWLAFMQLLTEVLVGGALFLALQDIFLKYSPDYYEDNLAYIAAVKTRNVHLALHTALREERNNNHIRLTVLKAERQAYINEKLVEFINLQSRFDSINNF